MHRIGIVGTALLAVAVYPAVNGSTALAQETMSFFLTSVGAGDGANLGGLEGADAHCEFLAYAVGADDRGWRAYLSSEGDGVNARDRIGSGPWYNAAGVLIARDVTDLHSESANLTKETILSEWGQIVNGRGDDPNRHDVLTGSDRFGVLFEGDGDVTCSDWTSNGEGSARVGHFDRQGGGDDPMSWNSAHLSSGCGQQDLRSTGGDGLFFCFATDASTEGVSLPSRLATRLPDPAR